MLSLDFFGDAMGPNYLMIAALTMMTRMTLMTLITMKMPQQIH
jgi:hypothetical protein